MEFDHSGRAGKRSRSGLFVDVRRIRWRRAALEQRKRDTKARYQRRGAQRHHDQSLFLALFQIVHPDLRRRSGFVPLLVDRAEFHFRNSCGAWTKAQFAVRTETEWRIAPSITGRVLSARAPLERSIV